MALTKLPLLLIFVFLCSCGQEKLVQPPHEPFVAAAAAEPKPAPDENNILDYIDSLQVAVTQRRSLAALQKLDSVACISDGYVTEAVDAAAARIWEQQFALLVRYLHHRPASLLRPQLIWGLSAEMFPAEDRAVAVSNFRATALDSARRAGLSTAEMVFLQQILREVDPALLD